MVRLTILLATSAALMVRLPAHAQVDTPTELPPQAQSVQTVLVPVPKEIFNLLDQFGSANWRMVQHPEIVRWKSHGDQVQIALLLGNVVAEGFIAMEAKDSVEIKNLGKRVLVLSRALGVEKTALRRTRSIMDAADAEKWAVARNEWDGVLADLQKRMIALKSGSLAELVSLSGWVRGTDALCVLVLQDYSAEKAELIRQPAILDYLDNQLLHMSPEMHRHTMVANMQKGLKKIRDLIGSKPDQLTQEKVKAIGEICRELVNSSSRRPD